MSDPKRLIESADGEGLAQALLESATRSGPTGAQRQAIWMALAPRLGPMSADPTTRHVGGAVLKGAGLLALVGAVTVIATLASRRPQTDGSPPGARVQPARTAEAEAPVGAPATGSASTVVAVSQPVPGAPESNGRKPVLLRPSARQPAAETDSLRLETRAMLAARDALRTGDCAGAVVRLNEARLRFQNGALPQEREVLAIEALDCAGRAAEAAQRAEEFLRSYPASPHGDLVRRFVP